MGGWGQGAGGGGHKHYYLLSLLNDFAGRLVSCALQPGGSISFNVTERCPGTQNQKITITMEERQRALVTAAVRMVIAFCTSFDMRVPSTHCVLG